MSDTLFINLACPNKYVFNPIKEECVNSDDYTLCAIGKQPNVTFLGLEETCTNDLGYYCSGNVAFTYCTPDNVKIVENKPCPVDEVCQNSDTPQNPCAKQNP